MAAQWQLQISIEWREAGVSSSQLLLALAIYQSALDFVWLSEFNCKTHNSTRALAYTDTAYNNTASIHGHSSCSTQVTPRSSYAATFSATAATTATIQAVAAAAAAFLLLAEPAYNALPSLHS